MTQQKKKETLAPISEVAFADLPVKFRPKKGFRTKARYKVVPHKIAPGDQLPATDSGYWINDFVPLERLILFGRYSAGKIFMSPPHGWFSNWTKGDLEQLRHTVGIDERFFQSKRRRLKRIEKIIDLLSCGISAWTPCNNSLEAARKYKKVLKK